ncbi:hypothetical protein SOVF_081760 [Spinacia oleracea]|nr:hypothetical protein SOVF_081760 [Spinacia oleracea]
MNPNVVVLSDHIISGVKIEEENVANFDGVFDEGLDDSGIKSSEQEQRCREIELEIQNKERNLVTIISKIRVLGGEKLRVEEEIKGLKEKKAVLIGAKGNAPIIMTPKNKRKRGEGDDDDSLPISRFPIRNIARGSSQRAGPLNPTPPRRLFKLENNDGEGGEGDDDVIPKNRVFKRVAKESESDDDDHPLLFSRQLRMRNIARESSKRAEPLNPTRPKRILKLENNDGMGEDGTPTRRGFKRVDRESGSDDDVSLPISQLLSRKIARESSQRSESLNPTRPRRIFKFENNDGEGEDGDESDDDIKPTRRGFKRVPRENESDDDDDCLPICQLLSRNIARASSQCASPLNPTRPRRRLVKCGQDELKDKPQKIGNVADDHESSEDESESSDRSLGSFIVDDSDCEDVKDDLSKEVSGDDDSDDDFDEEVSDNDLNFKDILSRLQSRRHPDSKWVSEADMLSDFGKNPELCMKAVCALYRLQTNEEKVCKASIVHNGRGFSTSDATRGTFLGEFLTDGVPNGNGEMVKTVEELQEYHPSGVEDCRSLANHYSKQLFKIYESGDDPYFL